MKNENIYLTNKLGMILYEKKSVNETTMEADILIMQHRPESVTDEIKKARIPFL
ncbi:hypothetical protein IKI14_05475 [bacterium]|nr:hypothetical protein [bacterium]